MKKSIRNLMIGAVMAAGVFAASSAALAATQYVQTDMNFRNGASSTATQIGSVPAGAQVDYLNSVNGWDLVTYNGVTGYIHGGCSPVGMKKPFPTFFDETILTHEKIFFSGGRVGFQVEVAVADIEKAIRYRTADLTVKA